MEIREIGLQDYQKELENCIKNKKEMYLYAIPPINLVLKGEGEIDTEYCKENGIYVYNSYNRGGTIYISAGDVDIGLFRNNGWEDCKYISEELLKYFKTKIENIKIDGNDFIVDDVYKVGSFSSGNFGDNKEPFIYTGMHLSLTANAEIINKICKKEMHKIPKGLNTYGVSNKEIVEELIKIIKTI